LNMRKYTLLSMILLIAIAVFATNASADLLVSSVTIGDDTQARGENVTASFTITNNGTSAITNLNFGVLNTDQNKYNISFPSAPASISAGQQISVSIIGYIPKDFNAVDDDNKAASFKIADLQVAGKIGSTDVSGSSEVRMQAENNLELKKVTVEFADKSESVSDGDNVENIKPGDGLTFTIEVENAFTDKEDINIEDVEVSVEADDGDFSDSDDDSLGDLNADEGDEISLTLDVDEDIDDGSYKTYVTVSGVDENGAKHGEKWEIKLEVTRKTHEILVQRTTVSPTSITCADRRRADLFLSIENTGKRDEDSVAVEVIASSISFRDTKTGIELDRDDSASLTFPIYVPATAQGDIDVVIKTFFDNDKQSDEQTIRITAEKCAVEEEEEEEETDIVTPTQQPTQPVQPTTTTGDAVAQARTTRTSSVDSSNTGLYIAMLAVGIIIVLALLMLLVLKLVR
jgi:hypothetical protein